MDVAATRVIRYMETVHGKVLKDYSYNELKQTKERELHLIGLLRDKERRSKNRIRRSESLAKALQTICIKLKTFLLGFIA
jgi:hypothetical protein